MKTDQRRELSEPTRMGDTNKDNLLGDQDVRKE